jgi:hypothetical protein
MPTIGRIFVAVVIVGLVRSLILTLNFLGVVVLVIALIYIWVKLSSLRGK